MTGMDLAITLLVTLLISTLTLLTGFGVGTVLTPTFTFFYDVKTAVFLVAVVHLANNLFKLVLFAKHVDWNILRRFGLVSLVGALGGSLLQGTLTGPAVRVVLALFLISAGVAEFVPKSSAARIPRKFDVLGGFFSGLLGGLIGNQGAIRSAYLLNYSISKEAFIGTATSISIIIDFTRIPLYLYNQSAHFQAAAGSLIPVILVAFVGTYVGSRLLKRLSLERFRRLVAAFLIAMGIALFVP